MLNNAPKIITQDQAGHGNAMAMILNADYLWKQALRDKHDDPNTIINNAGSLRHEDERKIQSQLVEIRRRSLNGILDLRSSGLTSTESITTQLVGRESINEFQAAVRSMNPTSFQNNSIDFELLYVPLPIIHQSWRIPFRQTGFDYKRSTGLSESVRQVSESLEDMLFNGASEIVVTVGSTQTSITGYTNNANRQTDTITDWTDLATNGAKIIPEVLSMIDKLYKNTAVAQPNSVVMYVAKDFWTNMQADYTTNTGGKTYKERIEQISEIKEVKPAEKLTNGTVVLVEMSDRTVDLVIASDIITVPHQRTNPLEDQVFTTYAAMVPIIKADRNSKTGIVHGTQA